MSGLEPVLMNYKPNLLIPNILWWMHLFDNYNGASKNRQVVRKVWIEHVSKYLGMKHSVIVERMLVGWCLRQHEVRNLTS